MKTFMQQLLFSVAIISSTTNILGMQRDNSENNNLDEVIQIADDATIIDETIAIQPEPLRVIVDDQPAAAQCEHVNIIMEDPMGTWHSVSPISTNCTIIDGRETDRGLNDLRKRGWLVIPNQSLLTF